MRYVLLAGLLGSLLTATPVAAQECTARLLVLSAYPGEIDMLLTDESADITATEEVDGRRFHVGRLRGHDVVFALSGIGLSNATHTTQTALDHYRCGPSPAITGIVFSGVAGGAFLGDVVIPARWTDDDGQTWLAVDETMLAVAAEAARAVELSREAPTGDPLCVGHDPAVVTTVTLEHEPEVRAGGAGKSTDPFNGRTFPCFPGGGDVFGCEPCRSDPEPPDLGRLPEQIAPFVDPDFFFGYFADPPPPATDWDAEDMESAAVARVAAAHGVPFIAFRGVSDGQGDPLMLPGFPFQFFYYRQLAADNAARVTLAFLDAWPPRPGPVVSTPAAVEPVDLPSAAGPELPATGGGLLLLGLAGLATAWAISRRGARPPGSGWRP